MLDTNLRWWAVFARYIKTEIHYVLRPLLKKHSNVTHIDVKKLDKKLNKTMKKCVFLMKIKTIKKPHL